MINYKDKISATLESNTDDLISFVQEIVRTPSLANEEQDVQEIFHNKLISLDMESRILPVNFNDLEHHPAFNDDGFSPDSRVNVTAIWNGSGSGKSLILNGHVDVVPVGPEDLWSESPWSAKIVDGKLYGRGSCDMKAGLASGL